MTHRRHRSAAETDEHHAALRLQRDRAARKEHRVLVPQAGKIPPAFREHQRAADQPGRIRAVARDYPIVFVTGDSGKTYAALRCWAWRRSRTCS